MLGTNGRASLVSVRTAKLRSDAPLVGVSFGERLAELPAATSGFVYRLPVVCRQLRKKLSAPRGRLASRGESSDGASTPTHSTRTALKRASLEDGALSQAAADWSAQVAEGRQGHVLGARVEDLALAPRRNT